MDYLQQAKEMVMELIRDQGFREQRGEYGSRVGGGETLDVSKVSFLRDRPFWAVTSLWAFSSSRFRFHGLQLELSSAEAERWSKRSRATRGSESSLNQVSNHHHLKCLLRNVGQWLKLMHHADKLMDHLTLLFWDRSPTMSRKGKEKENTIPHLLVLSRWWQRTRQDSTDHGSSWPGSARGRDHHRPAEECPGRRASGSRRRRWRRQRPRTWAGQLEHGAPRWPPRVLLHRPDHEDWSHYWKRQDHIAVTFRGEIIAYKQCDQFSSRWWDHQRNQPTVGGQDWASKESSSQLWPQRQNVYCQRLTSADRLCQAAGRREDWGEKKGPTDSKVGELRFSTRDLWPIFTAGVA